MVRLLLLALIFIFSCNSTKVPSKDAFNDFQGSWKEINQNVDQIKQLSLRTYYFTEDSSLEQIQYEPGNRNRVWMNVEKIKVKDHVLYYDEFSANLNSTKDTLTVNYHDPSGNIYPSKWIPVTDTNESLFIKGFIDARKNTYQYNVPNDLNDGWVTKDLNNYDIDKEKIFKMISEINNGKFHDIHSLLLIKNNQILLEEYFAGKGKLTGDFINKLYQTKLHHLASVTKPVTGLLAGCALDHQFIQSVNDPIYQYFPEYPQLQQDGKQYILVKHLLTMSAGFEWQQFGYSFQDSRNDAGNMYRTKDVVAYFFSKPVVTKPGASINYSNASATAVGALVKNASKMDIDKFAHKYLFEPLGIEQYKWNKYPDNTYDTDGSLALRPRDTAKIGQLILNSGVWDNKQIISKDWVAESTQNHLSRSPEIGYGYFWQLLDFNINDHTIHSIFAWGDGGQFIFLFPEIEMIVVSTAGNYGKNEDRVIFDMLERYILPAILSK